MYGVDKVEFGYGGEGYANIQFWLSASKCLEFHIVPSSMKLTVGYSTNGEWENIGYVPLQ